MPVPPQVILPLISAVERHLGEDVSLAAMARIAKRSPFELHRAFRRITGETTKGFTSRLRLERAAAQLVLERTSILDIALANGFASHEVFARAFLRKFRMSPRSYRARGLMNGATRQIAAKHAAVIRTVGPCLNLYQLSPPERQSPMAIDVSRQQLTARPALVIRRTIAPSEIAATIGPIYGRIVEYALRNGAAFTGQPFTRYVTVGRGLYTIEAGLPIASKLADEGEIQCIELPGGPAAVAIHVGPYDKLSDTHAAIERWIAAEHLEANGAPWETYTTDPGTTPDPAQWKTEVVHPLR